MSEWIPVSERLPDKHSRVLAAAGGKTHFAYICRHQHFHDDVTEGDLVGVTHWQPLPAPPTASREEG